MDKKKQTVAVLGASPKPQRYANKAVNLLREHGHHVIPIHPAIAEIDGLPVVASMDEIKEKVDTLTLYVSANLSSPLIDDILALNPGRVIFNPGTENPALLHALEGRGILSEAACTLILLNTGQF